MHLTDIIPVRCFFSQAFYTGYSVHYQHKAQRSGFALEMRSNEAEWMPELAREECSAVCSDERG